MSVEHAAAVTIRPTSAGDLDALKALISANDLFPPELLDDMIAPFFTVAGSPERWLTALLGGLPVAVAYYVPERMTTGTWNLLLIAVAPNAQRRGIGATITQHIEQELAADGERILLVETSGLPTFERTRGFYRRIGYGEEARIRDFYQTGEDKVVFRKDLTGRR